MPTPVRGDRETLQNFVRQTLDQAFADRISYCFDSLCISFQEPQSIQLFMDRFKAATDMWNAAGAAIAAEYPQGLVATPLKD